MMKAPRIKVPVITAAMIRLRVFTALVSRPTPDRLERGVPCEFSHGELEESG